MSRKLPPLTQKYFELRRSPIQGTGAFALRRIRKGTRIVEYTGERISHEEASLRYDDEAMKRHHTFLFTVDEKTCIDGKKKGNEAAFINHSCEPNCGAVIEDDRIFIEAIATIQPGEELFYDYSYELDSEPDEADFERYRCLCGTPSCRGSILKMDLPEKKPAKKAPKKKSAEKKSAKEPARSERQRPSRRKKSA